MDRLYCRGRRKVVCRILLVDRCGCGLGRRAGILKILKGRNKNIKVIIKKEPEELNSISDQNSSKF